MRTSIAGAIVLLAGAGATTAAAVTTGNNIALNGSDTLYEVTKLVISSCEGVYPNPNGFATKGITYVGGGSGVGAGQMALQNKQEIAPMSRALQSGEFCTLNPDMAASMMIGLDGVAIVAATTSTCSASTASLNGVGKSSIDIYPGGVVAGAPSGSYVLDGGATSVGGASIDALRVLFMGIDNTGVTSGTNFGCGTDLRKSLIKSWNNLFNTACAAGAGHCPNGLTHAWRRPDVSGTTDAFVGILTAVNGASRGLGTMNNVPTKKSQKINPFCNTFDAVDPQHPISYLNQTATLADEITTTALSNGRVNDQNDLDPVRTACGACTDAAHCADMVCGKDGTLGVVLPIFLPDAAPNYPVSEIYPTTDCSGSCVLTPVITGSALPPGFKCPNNTNPIAGRCFLPYIESVAKDPRCRVTDPTIRCFGTTGSNDGRVWNQPLVVLSSEVPAALRFAGATYQYGVDRNNRLMAGSFYRMHQLGPSAYNARPVAGSYSGTCQQTDDTGQIGCLADADDCSMGYAAREAARTFPGNTADELKALKVNTIAPFPDSNVTNLLVGSGSIYPLSRRLYVAAGPGGATFNTLPGQANPPTSGEAMLAKCFSQDSLVGAALTANGFIPIPATSGGVQCLDYDQTKSQTQPLVNVPGAGNIALPGCAAAANADGCSGVTTANGWRFGL
jgi:hypothetical protein